MMKQPKKLTAKLKFTAFALAALGLGGCNRASDTVFFTVTNAGLNFETTPPTVEVAISRREGVIQPEFEGGLHLPVVATMINRLGIGGGSVGATFIGGAAAEIAASEKKVEDESDLKSRNLGVICVSEIPTQFLSPNPMPGAGETRPFIFGTSTTFGLTVGWSGMTASAPDSLRFGYNRKELAIASAFMAEGCPQDIKQFFPANAKKSISMPSFIATIDGGFGSTLATNTRLDVNQTFATGAAARLIANDPGVRTAVRNGIAAATALSTANTARQAATAREAAANADFKALEAEAKARDAANRLRLSPNR